MDNIFINPAAANRKCGIVLTCMNNRKWDIFTVSNNVQILIIKSSIYVYWYALYTDYAFQI